MSTLFLALLASALAALGGRQARLVAQLSATLGGSKGLLAVCWLTAAPASALAAWLGTAIAPSLSTSGKAMVAAAALAAAALELAWPSRAQRQPAEPTRSLGAIALVLGVGQLADAARLLVFALSLASGNAGLAALGGAIGSGTALTLAWKMQGSCDAHVPLPALRLATGVLVLVAAASVVRLIG